MRSSRLLLQIVLALTATGAVSGFAPTRPLSLRSPATLTPNPFSSSSSSNKLQSSQSTSSSQREVSDIDSAEVSPNGENSGSSSAENKAKKPSFAKILWRFTRPHTIIGSAMAIPALHLLAAPTLEAALSKANAISMIYAMVPSLLMNLYITGLNQITDVEIDKINKPDLPIAAGLLSKQHAIIIVLLSLVVSLGMGVASPVYGTQGLNVALWGSAILGTIYSLEPFRLKRFPALAAFCIVAVRGAVINAGFFAHASAAAFGHPSMTVLQALKTDPRCLLSSAFFAVFGIVIALMKDVPDVKGDEVSNIRTFSVRLGQKYVFHSMRFLLSGLFYVSGAAFFQRAVEASGKGVAAARVLTGLAAVFMGWSVQDQSKDVDPMDSKQVYKFYMHLWKLFYGSYLVLPFAM